LKMTELPVSVTSPTPDINHYPQHISCGTKTKAGNSCASNKQASEGKWRLDRCKVKITGRPLLRMQIWYLQGNYAEMCDSVGEIP